LHAKLQETLKIVKLIKVFLLVVKQPARKQSGQKRAKSQVDCRAAGCNQL